MVFVNKSNTFYLKTFTSNDILRLYATYCSTKGRRRCLMSNVKSLKSPEFVELMNCGTVEALISPQLKSSNYELCIVNYSLLIAPDSPKLY